MKKSSKGNKRSVLSGIYTFRTNSKALLLLLFLIIAALPSLSAQTSAQTEEESKQFLQLLCTDYQGYIFRASSTLESRNFPYLGKYGMQTLFDGDQYTGWAEGAAGDGKGVVLWLKIDGGSDILLLKNGFGRSENLFYKNNRVKSLHVSLWNGYLPLGMVTEYGPHYVIAPADQQRTLYLKDERDVQKHTLFFDYEAALIKREEMKTDFLEYVEKEHLPPMIEKSVFLLRMEITGVYPGNTWNDTCLTELRCFDSDSFQPKEVESVEGAIRYRDEDGPWRFLYAEKELLFDPYLLSPDGRWCVSFITPESTEGRVETGYALFHLPYPELHENVKFSEAVDAGKIPVEFKKDDDALSLVFDDDTRIVLE